MIGSDPLNYEHKYHKYKNKYLHMKKLVNENKYNYILPYTNPKKIESISGPISLSIWRSDKYDKTILLFGDQHIASSNLTCAGDDKTLYLPKYLKMVFSKNNKKIIDVFIELPYQQNKRYSVDTPYAPNMIRNIGKEFGECFQNLYDKTLCNANYPNVRFHAMDLRNFLTDKFSNDIKLNAFIEFSDTLQDISSYNYRIKAKLDNNMKSLLQLIKNYLGVDEKNKFDEFYGLLAKGHGPPLFKKIYNTINDFVILNNIDDDKINQTLKEISLGLIPTDYRLKLYNYIKDFQYSDFVDILFDPNGKIFKNFNSIIDSTIRDSLIINIKKYINDILGSYKEVNVEDVLNKFKSSILSFDINNLDEKKNVDTMENIIFLLTDLVMDAYMVSRIFKNFTKKETSLLHADVANNIIIVAGDAHKTFYDNVFDNMGFNKVFLFRVMHTPARLRQFPELRCLDVKRMPNQVSGLELK
jgi:hypothetical protein